MGHPWHNKHNSGENNCRAAFKIATERFGDDAISCNEISRKGLARKGKRGSKRKQMGGSSTFLTFTSKL